MWARPSMPQAAKCAPAAGQSERGKITEETKAVLFPIDGFSDVNAEEVHKAMEEFVTLLHRFFGDSIAVETGVVDREHPRFTFFA